MQKTQALFYLGPVSEIVDDAVIWSIGP